MFKKPDLPVDIVYKLEHPEDVLDSDTHGVFRGRKTALSELYHKFYIAKRCKNHSVQPYVTNYLSKRNIYVYKVECIDVIPASLLLQENPPGMKTQTNEDLGESTPDTERTTVSYNTALLNELNRRRREIIKQSKK